MRRSLTYLIKAAGAGGAEKGLQFGERLFDRIEVRAVGRQEAEEGAGAFDGWPVCVSAEAPGRADSAPSVNVAPR